MDNWNSMYMKCWKDNFKQTLILLWILDIFKKVLSYEQILTEVSDNIFMILEPGVWRIYMYQYIFL